MMPLAPINCSIEIHAYSCEIEVALMMIMMSNDYEDKMSNHEPT